jgi:hypothetical protein
MSFLRHHNPEPSDKSITLAEQQNALIEWATNIDMEPKWRKEIMRKISKMDRVLEGDEYERFITELAELKLGIGVTEDEALEIMRLSEKANAAQNFKVAWFGRQEGSRRSLLRVSRLRVALSNHPVPGARPEPIRFRFTVLVI